MKRSKFSEQQIVSILREAEEGTPVDEVCRKVGVSQQSYYHYGHEVIAGRFPVAL